MCTLCAAWNKLLYFCYFNSSNHWCFYYNFEDDWHGELLWSFRDGLTYHTDQSIIQSINQSVKKIRKPLLPCTFLSAIFKVALHKSWYISYQIILFYFYASAQFYYVLMFLWSLYALKETIYSKWHVQNAVR